MTQVCERLLLSYWNSARESPISRAINKKCYNFICRYPFACSHTHTYSYIQLPSANKSHPAYYLISSRNSACSRIYTLHISSEINTPARLGHTETRIAKKNPVIIRSRAHSGSIKKAPLYAALEENLKERGGGKESEKETRNIMHPLGEWSARLFSPSLSLFLSAARFCAHFFIAIFSEKVASEAATLHLLRVV